MIYSDGVSEAGNSRRVFFEEAGLAPVLAALLAHCDRTQELAAQKTDRSSEVAASILNDLIAGVDQFAAVEEQADDITEVVLQRLIPEGERSADSSD